MPYNQQTTNNTAKKLIQPDAPTPVFGPAKASPGSRQLYEQYQKAQIETASPTHLIILLYDGAIKFCSRALEGMQKKDLQVQHNNLVKVQRIVAELMGSLDKDIGGEIADNLFRLYAHMLQELVSANLYDKIEQVENVKQMLEDLRETWQQVDRRKLQPKLEKEQPTVRTISTAVNSSAAQKKITVQKPVVPPVSRLSEQNA